MTSRQTTAPSAPDVAVHGARVTRLTIAACTLLALAPGCIGTEDCAAGLVFVAGTGCVPADAGSADAGLDASVRNDVPDDSPDAPCTDEYFADEDMDGHGDPATGTVSCVPVPGRVMSSDDCDDTSAARFSGNPEICDALDNDCDEPMVDEDFACVRGASVACTTSCGSMGMGPCATDCMPPSAALCTPPTEVCNGADDDCDGRLDEDVLTVGPRRDLGMGGHEVVVVPTRTGFAAFDGGFAVHGQRLDSTGAPMGSSVTVTTATVGGFDAYAAAGQVVVAYQPFGRELQLTRYEDDLTAPFTTSVAGMDVGGPVRFVASGSSAILVNFVPSDFTSRATRLAYPSLTGATSTGLPLPHVQDIALDPRLGMAHVWLATDPTPLEDHRVPLSGAVSGTRALHLRPALAGPSGAYFHPNASGAGRILVAYPASGAVRVELMEVAADSSVVSRATADLVGGLHPGANAHDVDITYALGRFFVASLNRTSDTATNWAVYEVWESADGTSLRVVPHVIEASADATSVSITADSDGTVLTAATRSFGTMRAYVLGCP